MSHVRSSVMYTYVNYVIRMTRHHIKLQVSIKEFFYDIMQSSITCTSSSLAQNCCPPARKISSIRHTEKRCWRISKIYNFYVPKEV
jgi:hypothetical protein